MVNTLAVKVMVLLAVSVGSKSFVSRGKGVVSTKEAGDINI